ncbi:glycosyltransferase [Methanobrevibacter olleyae]|uniref:Glycosyl transferase GT2 family n=1 Tax=Methanobrevibacter olleyae TaxID=294671 RepID=A0A126QZ59_METOL|nr:glycosyltransferase [Methanobrevibacter olleyae]AMK15420.1 glycosyl transferase GT2 family [Methanobrevibacter olleyae]
MVKISVIIPIYNAEHSIKSCLESVLKQTLKDIEIICVNDGSTDRSLKILNEYAEKDSRIKLFNKENGGVGDSRNLGIDNAIGEYIAFLDADDIIVDDDSYYTLYHEAKKHNLEMVSGGIQFVGKNKISYENEWFKPIQKLQKRSSEEYGIPWYFYKNIFKRDFLNKHNIRFPSLLRGQDPVFFSEILTKIDYYYEVPIIYYSYTAPNEIKVNNSIKFLEYFKHFYEVFDILIKDKRFAPIIVQFSKILIEMKDRPIHVTNKQELLELLKVMDDLKSLYVNFNNDDLLKQVCSAFDKIIDRIDIVNVDMINLGFKNIEDNYSKGIVVKDVIKKPKISIVIPVYNVENYLEKCLNSVINQTLANIEIICINDGSTDNSLKILNQFANKDNRIKVFSFENAGLGPSRNRGIDRANGEYVAFLDSDDWLNLTFCEEIYKSASKNKADIVLFNAVEEYNDYKRKRIYFSKKIINDDSFVFDFRWNPSFILDSFFTVWSKLHRTEFLKENNIRFPSSLFEDMEFQVESYLKAKRICYNPNIFYHYRKENPKSIMNSLKGEDCYCIFDIINRIESHLKSNGVMKVYKNYFLKFKIIQLQQKLANVPDDFKEVYFKLIKDEFLKMDMSMLDLEYLPSKISRFYIFILNSSNYRSFFKLNSSINSNIQYINKNRLINEINKFNDIGVTSIKRKNKIIVSLTSFPERMQDIYFCLFSLLNQNFKPDEVILWLSDEQFPNKENDVPQNVLDLKNNGLTIKWCKDIGSYKKLLPSLEEYPNDFIVTADDDIFYPKNWLKNIWEEHKKYPNEIISCRTRIISYNSDKSFNNYNDWKLALKGRRPSYFNFFTTGGGTLFIPNSLSKHIFDEKLFLELCPLADDIWFWAMAVLNKTKIKCVDNPMPILCYINPARDLGLLNEKTLWEFNKLENNDKQFNNIISHFPELLDILFED